MKYTTEQIERISEKFRRMPIIQKSEQLNSKQKAIKILSKEIAALQKKGYSFEQISELLREEGIHIVTPRLKSYLQRAKQKTQKLYA